MRAPPGVEAELEHLEKTFWQDFTDAVSVRTVALISGVLLLQLGFILSYVGAFHHPSPIGYRSPSSLLRRPRPS